MKRIISLILTLYLCPLIFPLQILAQENDIDLERIVITPSRIEEEAGETGRSIDIITSADLQKTAAGDLAGALQDLGSVNISDYGGLAGTKTLKMRGSSGGQVLVLVDGRPISSPRDGEADISNIPIDNIERVEIVHGPGASLYGSGAMGGTVNIITKKPPKEKQKTDVSISAGTFRTYITQLAHGARVARLGYLLSGSYKSSGGFRTNSTFNAKDFNTKFEYELNSNNNLTLNSGFYKSRSGAPGPVTNADRDNIQASLKNYLDLNWSFKPDETTGFSSRVYQNYDRLEFMDNELDSIYDVAAFYKAIHTTNVRGLDLQFTKRLFEHYLGIFGFNYVANFNDSTNTAKHKYNVRAWYLENQLDLFEKWKLNFSVRVDDYSNFGLQASPNLNILYSLNENFKLHGLISRSFRAPTFNDLYWPNEGWAIGNPNLKPEKGTTGEFGLDVKINQHFSSGFSYYRSKYTELINWMESQPWVWSPVNIGSAIIDGIEFNNKIYLPFNLELGLDYAFLRAKDAKSKKYLIYQPNNKVDLSLKYKNVNGLTLEFKGQFTDRRFHNAENTIYVKKFFVFGFNAAQKFKDKLTCFVNIDNLLGNKYQNVRDYPMPGFAINSGLKVDF